MHLPASHFFLQQPTLFVNHTLRSFEILQQPNSYTKQIYREELSKSDKQSSLSSDRGSPTDDFSTSSQTSANSELTLPSPLSSVSISNMSLRSNKSRWFDSVIRPSGSSPAGQKPVQCYNLDIYAPAPQFPSLQSSKLPYKNPSFEVARFLKNTGPGSSKLQDNSSSKSKLDRNKYKLMIQSVKKATNRKLRSEEESSLNFKPPLVGVVQKISKSGNKYLQIVTPTSESDDNLSDHDEQDDYKCSVIPSKPVDVEDLKKWIAGLDVATEIGNQSEEILPSQNDRSAIRRLRKSQSLDFEPCEADDESKADIPNVSPQDFPTPPVNPFIGAIRPRSSSLKGPPRTVIMPSYSVSESTLSCTESEERLMESPTPEAFPRTEYITMTYDESQDNLQTARGNTNVQDMPNREVQGSGSNFRYREPGYEVMDMSIIRPLPGNLPEENEENTVEEDDDRSIRHGSTGISQLSSDDCITYDYKSREGLVRKQKIKDLYTGCERNATSDDNNIKVVEDKIEETMYTDSGNRNKGFDARYEPQVLGSARKPVVDVTELMKHYDTTNSSPASRKADTSPAMPKEKDLDVLHGVPDHKLIHPAYRTQLVGNKYVGESAQLSYMKKAGIIDANNTLPNSIYHKPSPIKDGSSPIPTSQVHTYGKDKPLPPIHYLRPRAHTMSNDTMDVKSKKAEATIASAMEERKQSLDISHQNTFPGSTAAARSFSSSSSTSQTAKSVPIPSSSFTSSPTSSVTAFQSICQPSPPRIENLEQRVKQLEHEKLLLRNALSAVLNTAGTQTNS